MPMNQGTIAVAILCLSAASVMAEPVLGVWQTQPGDDGNYGHVTMSACGASICGVVTKGFNSSGGVVSGGSVGKRIVWDMQPDGGGKYSGGRIYAPDRDKTYRAKMSLSGARLKVSGCVGPICRAQTWVRVK